MSRKQKIFITGCAGVLGSELREQLKYYGIAHDGSDIEVDIRDIDKVRNVLAKSKSTTVIHCAGIIDVPRCEVDKQLAYDVNYVGAMNVARACRGFGIQMVQISSDYVYRGDKQYIGDGIEGNYEVGDYLDPINYYAFTKTLADIAVQGVSSRFLICRLSFKKKGPWPYPKAFVDQYTSRDTVDVLAKQIIHSILASRIGVVHLGTKRKTVYELAKRQSPNVEPISINDIKNVVLPKDTSLKITYEGEVL